MKSEMGSSLICLESDMIKGSIYHQPRIEKDQFEEPTTPAKSSK